MELMRTDGNAASGTVVARVGAVGRLLLCLLLTVVPVVASNPADREDFTRDFEKSLTVTSGQPVRLEHRNGNVSIRTHVERQFKLQASIRVSGRTSRKQHNLEIKFRSW